MGTADDTRMQGKGPLKFIRGATSIPAVEVADLGGLGYDRWKQVDLVGPAESNLDVVVGIAEHPTNNVFALDIWYHQISLVLAGEMVVQDTATGNVYRAREGDLFYWKPGLKLRLGGKFRIYYVQTPVATRWVHALGGKKAIDQLHLEGESSYEPSSPDEVRTALLEDASDVRDSAKIKFIRGAMGTSTVQAQDISQMNQDQWRQVDLVNPSDTRLTLVAGIAEHPTLDMPAQGTYFWYHQLVLILGGEMVIEDLDTGGVFRARQGDFSHWPPNHAHKNGGIFRAFFVKTPIPMRWVRTAQGKKLLDMLALENETQFPASPPDVVQGAPLDHV